MSDRKNEILLDAGTGELEILEFQVDGVDFAINVAKVQEIVINQNVVATPLGKVGVKGIMSIRDSIYTVIDLKKILFDKDTVADNSIYYILTNFNNLHMAFMVEKVENIRRCGWSEMIKPSAVLNSGDNAGITGILNFDGEIISVLDFEKIVTDIAPELGLDIKTVNNTDKDIVSKRNNYTVLVADDSKMLNKMITDTIHSAGYNVISVEDGKQSLDLVLSDNKVNLLVTDIEMPVMDGLESSRLIKEKKPEFPIIAFSSLINDALMRKIENLKLDGACTKPEIGQLVDKIDKLIVK